MTDGFGLENQKESGLKLAERLGMEAVIHNEGSASSHSDNIEERPTLSKLMYMIEEGNVKNLYVYNNDRLSRNESVWFHIRLKLKDNGVTLYVGDGTKYNLDHPMDEFIFGIMSEVSKYDNSIRTERLRRGKLSKIKSGGWMGGPPPFGYEIIDGRLEPNAYEKKWVRKIYEEYANGASIYQITKMLMQNGVVSRRNKIIWNDASVRKILTNTHFEGYFIYTDKKLNETVRVDCPKLLPMTLIKRVRKKFSNITYKSNYQKTVTLLRDFLVCGHCGSKFGQRIAKSQYGNHYFCRGNTERRRTEGVSEKICIADGIRVRALNISDVDAVVWEKVIDVVQQSVLFKEIFKDEYRKTHKSFGQTKHQIDLMRKKVKRNEKQILDINEAINSSAVDTILDKKSKADFKGIINKFEEKKRELTAENEELVDTIYQSNKSVKWYDWISEFKDKIDDMLNPNMAVEEKKKFLEGVIDKIVVKTVDKHQHSLEIVFAAPYVDDKLIWKQKNNPKKGYSIEDGQKDILLSFNSADKRLKKKVKETELG